MSRRQHVVRSDDQSGQGAARFLGGCTILCGHEDSGNVDTEVQIAVISVGAGVDYQRCFVAATVGHINVVIPEVV
jgi:hypothetical protein